MIENILARFLKAKSTILVIIGLGSLFRIVQYFNNRSLWVDEAKLSLNVIERGFIGLLHPLDYAQSAPAGFLWLQKLSTLAFGNSEFALRLIPLVSQLLSLYLLYVLGQRLISKQAIPLALAFFSASSSLLYFATEAKQYSTDILVALLILALVCWLKDLPDLRPRQIILACVLGSLLIWFSFPAAFVLAGTGFVLLVTLCLSKAYRRAACLLVINLCWGLSFFGFAYLALKNAGNVDGLQASWGGRGSFMPFPPTSLADFHWFIESFLHFFENPLYVPFSMSPYARPGILLTILGFILGVISLLTQRLYTLCLLTAPIVTTLLASGLEKYPFKDRLLLFLIPFIILVFSEGIAFLSDNLFRNHFKSSLIVILSAIILFQPYLSAAKGLVKPEVRHEMRPLMAYIKAHYQPNEHLYAYELSAGQFVYYAKRFGFEEKNYTLGKAVEEFSTEIPYQPDLDSVAQFDKVWFVFSNMHIPSEMKAIEAYLNTIGQELDSHQESGAIARLYQFSPEVLPR